MGYICLDCFNKFRKEVLNQTDDIYTKKYNGYTKCPLTNCGGVIFEIDDLILPTIEILNRKDYKTSWSCSGHYDASLETISTYIAFKHSIYIPDNIPCGFTIEDEILVNGSIVIRKNI